MLHLNLRSNPDALYLYQSLISSLSVSSDGRLVASGSSYNGDLVLWDLTTGRSALKFGGDKLIGVRQDAETELNPRC